MPFNYDFRRDLSRYRHLDVASTPGNSSYLSTTLSSLASHDSTSSYLSGPLDEYFKEPLPKENEERYVQPGIRDVRIIEKYLLGEIEVPDEVVFTWLPGYTPKMEKKKEEESRTSFCQVQKLEIEMPRRESQHFPKVVVHKENQKSMAGRLSDQTNVPRQPREKPIRRVTYAPEAKISATSTPIKRISLPSKNIRQEEQMTLPRRSILVSPKEEKPAKKEESRCNQIQIAKENILQTKRAGFPIPPRRSSDICVPQKENLETPVRRSSAYTYVLRIVPTP